MMLRLISFLAYQAHGARLTHRLLLPMPVLPHTLALRKPAMLFA